MRTLLDGDNTPLGYLYRHHAPSALYSKRIYSHIGTAAFPQKDSVDLQ